MRNRAFRLTLASAGILFGLAAEWAFYQPSLGLALAVADFAVGALLFGCGAVAWERSGASRVGLLMMLAGLAWFLGNLGGAAVYLHRGPLVQLVLSYPTGRLRRRLDRVVVAVAWADALIAPVARSSAATLVLAAAVVLAAVSAFVGSKGPARRARATALAAAVALAGALSLAALDRMRAWGHYSAVLVAYDVLIGSIALTLVVDLVRARWAEAAVRGLVVDLGAAQDVAGLQARLARALGDPTLVLGYRVPESAGFVDDAGRPISLPVAGSGRTATALGENAHEIGVLVHDDALLADPELIASVAGAARLAVANARLQAEARTQAEELERSRRRIVEVIDHERRRLEHELRAGPERRLDGAREALSDAAGAASADNAAALAALAGDLGEAERELRAFANGIRPAVLSGGGLLPALTLLATHSPVPTSVAGTVGRLSEPAEAALYFVCSEALANVAKHARATSVSIRVAEQAGFARAVVVDDGVGGAAIGSGSGLAGLADRVEALGGKLRVESPPGSGTRVIAEVPARPAGPGPANGARASGPG
jgi:signal transduction histidine kinase